VDGEDGAKGDTGATGAIGPQGAVGSQGPQGPVGLPGDDGLSVIGSTLGIGDPDCPFGGSMFVSGGTTTFACNGEDGLDGAAGAIGPQGDTGAIGPQGDTGAIGPQGDTGATGPSWILEFGYFYALMPGDNAATVAPGTAVSFPRDGAASGGIFGVTDSQFNLPTAGVYEVFWQVSVSEAGQLVLALDGVEQAHTVAGRATGTSQITNQVLLVTTTENSRLTVRNPAGNPAALTVTPVAGGARPVSASLVVKKIQ
jgi:hypothetical protein